MRKRGSSSDQKHPVCADASRRLWLGRGGEGGRSTNFEYSTSAGQSTVENILQSGPPLRFPAVFYLTKSVDASFPSATDPERPYEPERPRPCFSSHV